MLQAATLAFLADLKANNSKPWFDANRPNYEAARADFLALVTEVLRGLQAVDPALAQTPLDPRKCIFRINRDVRFSADKTPYKTNFGAWFNVGGKGAPTAGYYLNVAPGGAFAAGGLYMPANEQLAAVRQEIDYNLTAFEQLLAAPTFRRYFDGLSPEYTLQRPPKGYEATNPALPYLKLKSFTASHPLPDAQLRKVGLAGQVVEAFDGLRPLVAFLNHAVA